MAAAGNTVMGNPNVEDNPRVELRDPIPEGTKGAEVKRNKCGCSCMALAVLAGAFIVASAAATAIVVGRSLLTEGEPEPAVASVSGSLVLGAADATMLAGDGRFHVAVRAALASTLATKTGGNVTADDVHVTAATRRLAATTALRRHWRRLEGDFVFIDYYIVFQDGERAPELELATQILRTADPAALTAKINTEMMSRGFDQDMEVEVVGISAGEKDAGEGIPESPSGVAPSGWADSEHDESEDMGHLNPSENMSSPFNHGREGMDDDDEHRNDQGHEDEGHHGGDGSEGDHDDEEDGEEDGRNEGLGGRGGGGRGRGGRNGGDDDDDEDHNGRGRRDGGRGHGGGNHSADAHH